MSEANLKKDTEKYFRIQVFKDHGVGSPDHFSRHAKQNGNEMKQVMNHNKDNGLLNMIRRTDTMIFTLLWHCEQKSVRNVPISREKTSLFHNLCSQIILFSTFLIIFAHRTPNAGQK